jgi:hypothetical protein
MKTLAFVLLLLGSTASAQDVNVILFGSGDIDVGFTYDEANNTLVAPPDVATSLCPGVSGAEIRTVLQQLTPNTPVPVGFGETVPGLSIAGITTFASGCAVEWGGFVDISGTPSIYEPDIGYVGGSVVPEPPMPLLCAMGMVGCGGPSPATRLSSPPPAADQRRVERSAPGQRLAALLASKGAHQHNANANRGCVPLPLWIVDEPEMSSLRECFNTSHGVWDTQVAVHLCRD